MTDKITKVRFLRCLRKALFPFAKLLIHLGFDFRDFNSVAKLAFLDAAAEHCSGRGGATKSKLSEFSGVSKRDVSTLLQAHESGKELKDRRVPASEVLNEWSTNPAYSQPNGEPSILPIEGKEHSLDRLVENVGSNFSRDEIIDELVDSGAIQVLDGDRIRLIKRAQIFSGITTSSVYHFERTMYTMGSTLVANMMSAPDESKLLERASYTYGLRQLALPKFLLLTRSSSESFIELVDEWISANEDNAEKLRGAYVTGVGVYAFHAQDNPPKFTDLTV